MITTRVKKTKKPLEAGMIVRRWGTRYKAMNQGDKGLLGVVVNVVDNDTVDIVNHGVFDLWIDANDPRIAKLKPSKDNR